MSDLHVIIIEAKPVRRQRLASMIAAKPGAVLVASCASLMEAYTSIEAEVPNLVLVSKRMSQAAEFSMIDSLLGLLEIESAQFSDDTSDDEILSLIFGGYLPSKASLEARSLPTEPESGRLPQAYGVSQRQTNPARSLALKAVQSSLKSEANEHRDDLGEGSLARRKFEARQSTTIRRAEDETHSQVAGATDFFNANRNRTAKATAQEAIILIGASTGGVEALHQILPLFPADCPPVVVVQHIRGTFSASFAERLNRICAAQVMEAQNGVALTSGRILVAPGDSTHLQLVGRHPVQIRLAAGPTVTGHRPSVDAMFGSALPLADRIVAGLLTGMGADGARGLLALKNAGAFTIAQDQATSTVYGMPRVAAELGAASRILPLSQIAHALLAAAAQRVRRARDATGHS